MATYNIFKIHDNKKNDFLSSLGTYQDEKAGEVEGKHYKVRVYYFESQKKSKVKWSWLFNEFQKKIDISEINKQPSAILTFEIDNTLIALSFGSSFSKIYKFADKGFPFSFARKFHYEDIKATSHSSPNSKKIKTINSFIKNTKFEYESGHAYTKIKGSLVLDDNFSLFTNKIEIGGSLKLCSEVTLIEDIVKVLIYVLNVVEVKEDMTKIPVLNEIKDENAKQMLLQKLRNSLKEGLLEVQISDFDIIGTNEMFYSQYNNVRIICERHRKDYDCINFENVMNFCTSKKISLEKNIEKIRIVMSYEDGLIDSKMLIELIDFHDDEYKAVLINGVWHNYNDDYIESLRESLSNLECVYDSEFDFDQTKYDNYIKAKIEESKNLDEYKNLSNTKIAAKIKRKYYLERVYNELFKDNGFKVLDRKMEMLSPLHTIEVADIANEDTLFSVKFGNSSAKLCYVLDQSSSSIPYIKSNNEFKKIKTICIVLVLERKNVVHEVDNSVNLLKLKMFSLIDKINNWQKIVSEKRYIPKVIIAYKNAGRKN